MLTGSLELRVSEKPEVSEEVKELMAYENYMSFLSIPYMEGGNMATPEAAPLPP